MGGLCAMEWEMPIDRDEFLAAMARVEKGLDGIHTRLDVLNGRTRKSEERLTRLETIGAVLVTVGGAVWGLVEFLATHAK